MWHIEGRDRRAADHARPRRAAGLVQLRRNHHRSRYCGFGILSVPGPYFYRREAFRAAVAFSRPEFLGRRVVYRDRRPDLLRLLQPPFLQELMGYLVITAGLVMGPRGIGTMASILIVRRL